MSMIDLSVRGQLQRFILNLALFTSSTGVLADEWAIVDLGDLGGGYSTAFGINGNGDVVGESHTADGVTHAFLYSNGTMQDLGALNGTHSTAYGVNIRGEVVGFYRTGDGSARAFLYARGEMRDLGTLGGDNSVAHSINARGHIVGYANPASVDPERQFVRAFRYVDGRMRDLGSLNGRGSKAVSTNTRGQVVGLSNGRAFLHTGGKMRDLGTLGGLSSEATGINIHGQVVGYSRTGDGRNRAFLYSSGAMQELPDLGTNGDTYAFAINNLGQIVGSAGGSNAFLYSDGVMTDLSALPEVAAAGWTALLSARAINDVGQIAGEGLRDGRTRAFLLSPVRQYAESTTFMPLTTENYNRARSFARAGFGFP